jgi:hypothetical protein
MHTAYADSLEIIYPFVETLSSSSGCVITSTSFRACSGILSPGS